ncbi:asparaginase [Paractinoplanes brasiliensis]|uniref:Asparaginase n=1 Tax=Paractinoplanes brasiliensis TaxID=52695 RepID=A0A4R6JTK3_9ACTN|nr:asparaginase [Actinoplanes brasiliensis]TDO39984.1 asparaginase [Actinoplanes brasiliensis]GID25049.1 asparaginase [Actinoplanes brasiliensis]
MIIAQVLRSGFVESVHHGSVFSTAGSRGDVASPIFPRSSNKPLQTVGMLRAGLVPRDDADLALISGSHFGEPFHVRRVREILAAAGLGVDALRCPASLPLAESARDEWLRTGGGPERVLMNCSGKHAGMLATCVANDWPVESYLDPAHPLQVAIARAVADLAGEKIAAVGVDGCGAPVLALSLTGLARAFERLVTAEPGSHERRVADEMRAHPELVAGTAADDTVLMAAVPGLLAKGGAEGVVAVAVPGAGAIAIKIDDGGMRARTPVLLDELDKLGVKAPVIEELILGGGEPVGRVRAVR